MTTGTLAFGSGGLISGTGAGGGTRFSTLGCAADADADADADAVAAADTAAAAALDFSSLDFLQARILEWLFG